MTEEATLVAIGAMFWISQSIVFLIVMAPVTRFFDYGWKIRKQEFVTRIVGGSISPYLARFWNSTIVRRKWSHLPAAKQFEHVYDVIAGRRIYIMPIALLAVCLILFGGLSIQSAIRLGYEWYIHTYVAAQAAEHHVFIEPLRHLPLDALNAVFIPLPPVLLNLPALTAVAGAYLAVVQTCIYGYKTRTLLSSDLLWASFRLVIAVPLGFAVSGVAGPSLGGLISFGLGAFPIAAAIKLLRRLTSHALTTNEAENPDDLLKMTGVTPDVSARLNDEGVFSPQQLADTDPVSLAIRAGLSFDFVLNLVAQSQVWSFVGDTAAKMAPLGCADARTVRKFFGPGAALVPAPPILAALSLATGIEAGALLQTLQLIANEPFTQFLSDLG